MTRLSASSIARDVQSGARSAVSIAEETLARCAAYDAIQPQIWITRRAAEDILHAAKAIDTRIARGESLPLAGVPYAVKDNIDVAGLPLTAACPAFSHVPETSAEVIRRLEDAGALLIGKTNLDQFATGLVGARSPYGAPTCVFNHAYVSGGSSSGSAVSVAAELTAFALGTDTAGSGRVPAAFNHLIGFKPTKGRWSTRGLLPACRSLDCITVFANDVTDAALVDGVLAAFDADDPYSRSAPERASSETPRIGLAPLASLDFDGDAESRALYETAVAHLTSLARAKAHVDIAPLLDCAKLLYEGPWVAERTAALMPLLRSNPGAIHPTVRAIVEKGLAFSAVQTFEAQYALQAYLRGADAMWRDIDILVLPTTPTIFPLDAVRADPIALNAKLGRFTNFVNLLDMSAIAIPAGFRANGTGFGVTLIGPAWADSALFTLAQRYMESFTMPATPPLDLTPRSEGVKLAVVGAHLQGMPLHHQLTERNARFIAATKTAPTYKLFAMPTTPPKPALVHDASGAAIDVEIYELSLEGFGSFVTEIPAPLAMGTVTLADGTEIKGFVAEPRALAGAEDVTKFGGWRAYRASLTP
jgi:allophanate hydrolase